MAPHHDRPADHRPACEPGVPHRGAVEPPAAARAGRRRRAAVALLLAALVVAACGGAPATPAPGEGRLRVVATTTILADLAANVAGDLAVVDHLVPRGGEVHTFDPSPSDVRRVAEADLVLLNGLGLDEWLAALVADAGTAAPVVELAEGLPGVTYIEGAVDGDAHAGEEVNPHLWLDASIAARYVTRIGEALAAADPEHAAAYAERAATYGATLDELHAELAAAMAAIPAANRTVLSFHDAFPYFAAAYGLEIDGTIVAVPGQDPSAGELADLVELVRARGIRAILAEAQFSPDLAETIAGETGAVVVTDLLTDSTGDPPLDTYVALMRRNVERLVTVLSAP